MAVSGYATGDRFVDPNLREIGLVDYITRVPWVAVGIKMLQHQFRDADIERVLMKLNSVSDDPSSYQLQIQLIKSLI